MSIDKTLYTQVHARFHEAFGPPHAVEGGGEQWTLAPAAARSNAIHVLLNGTPDEPGIWVFDPYDAHTGVENTHIVGRAQIGDVILNIQHRLRHAIEHRDGKPDASDGREDHRRTPPGT